MPATQRRTIIETHQIEIGSKLITALENVSTPLNQSISSTREKW